MPNRYGEHCHGASTMVFVDDEVGECILITKERVEVLSRLRMRSGIDVDTPAERHGICPHVGPEELGRSYFCHLDEVPHRHFAEST